MAKSKTILRYGALWPADAHPAEIELACIAKLGQWEMRGKKCGNGLAYHMNQFDRMAWPSLQRHRWTDLMTEQFCKGGRLGVFGPSSTWKSTTFSRCALTMFYARPHGTTVIISSTTLDSLRRRIWDYVVAYDKMARQTFPWLPGSLIESKTMLLADASSEDGRSFKNGIVGVACKKGGKWQGLEEYCGTKNDVFILLADECFPAGTMVDTPSGPFPIEGIQPGDLVNNATGTGTVIATSHRIPCSLLEIKTKNGKTIRCTPNHPFFTQKGWKKACDLSQEHFIIGTNEALRILQSANSRGGKAFLRKLLLLEVEKEKQPIFLPKEKTSPTLSMVQGGSRNRNVEQVLQPKLLDIRTSRTSRIRRGKVEKVSPLNAGRPCEESEMEAKSFRAHEEIEPNEVKSLKRESQESTIGDWAQTENQRRKRNGANGSRTNPPECVSELQKQLSSKNQNEMRERLPDLLQGGCCVSGSHAGSGSGWKLSQQSKTPISRRKEGWVLDGDWVDSVEIIKPQNKDGNGCGDYGTLVYNLQVAGHPSYSVQGLLVHNCHFMPIGFLDALANLESNGTVFTAMMGNLPDVHNPLASACEPKLGWESLPDTEKSRVYETRWFNGRAIQLIGMDSPNLDYPEGQEPFKDLIGRRYIDQCAYNYGRESDKFNMFASGKIPRASMNRTVFTKAQAIRNMAMESVVWGHHPVVRGYAMDAAYSGVGGDRTPGAPFIFGKDNEGNWRLQIIPYKIYAGSSDPKKTHAEVIAQECMMECMAHGIPPEHVFYDGTGRSELTIALARIWSSKVVPIEFGGPATERPAFSGERHLFGENQGERKTCREMYDRFVSELWFAWSYCITSGQMRGLTGDIIDEGCQRKWELVRGAKQSVETKEDMKERGLRSPDLSDMVVVAVEGARRLGFPLGKDSIPTQKKTNKWLAFMAQEEIRKIKEQELTAA